MVWACAVNCRTRMEGSHSRTRISRHLNLLSRSRLKQVVTREVLLQQQQVVMVAVEEEEVMLLLLLVEVVEMMHLQVMVEQLLIRRIVQVEVNLIITI